MNNLSKVFVFIFLALLCSCQPEDEMGPTAGDPVSREILMEMNVHQTTVDQYEQPDEELHADFMSNSLRLLMNRGDVLASRNQTSGVSDTIFSYHEIPLIRETRSKFLIFGDGSSEALLEDITPDGINPLYSLSEVPCGDDMIISRTHIKNGRLRIYDKKNTLLVDEAYPDDNLKNFVDSVLQFYHSGDGSQKVSNFTDWISKGISRKNLPDGTVVLEQELGSMPSTVQAVLSAGPMKAVTRLNEEMTRTLQFELYSGTQLMHRKSYEYEESGFLKNYVNGKVVSTSPKSINSETIQLSGDNGKPVIYTSRTVYHRNQTKFSIEKEGVE